MRRTGLVLATILSLASSASFAAPGDDTNIVASIRDLQASLVALLPPPSNVRITPPMPSLFSPFRQENGEFPLNTPPAGTATVSCSVVNVANDARRVEVRFFRRTSSTGQAQTVQAGLLAITLEPGEQRVASDIKGLIAADLSSVYCRMTVLDGTRNDIRGAIALRLNDQVIAALPAE